MLDSNEARRLSLQEALRIIGNELETHEAQQSQIVVNADGIEVDSRGKRDAYLTYSWDDLAAASRVQIARRTAQQQPPPWMDPWALTRWSVLLRVTGQLLDTQGVEVCTIESALGATPEAVVLRVLVRGEEVFRRTEVEVELFRLRSQTRGRARAALVGPLAPLAPGHQARREPAANEGGGRPDWAAPPSFARFSYSGTSCVTNVPGLLGSIVPVPAWPFIIAAPSSLPVWQLLLPQGPVWRRQGAAQGRRPQLSELGPQVFAVPEVDEFELVAYVAFREPSGRMKSAGGMMMGISREAAAQVDWSDSNLDWDRFMRQQDPMRYVLYIDSRIAGRTTP